MDLIMKINNVKSIAALEMSLPLERGLYAITGENSSGKSTVVACAATVFFNMPMYDYFGRPKSKASIMFELNNNKRGWEFRNNKWNQINGYMNIKGFYEGSIIYGNRFRNTRFKIIKTLDQVKKSDLIPASTFVKEVLGEILHNDKTYFNSLFKVYVDEPDLKGDIYFYEKNGSLISQAHMSTGENLLVSILHSLSLRVKKRSILSTPCLIFLDEIELALHSSALRRLVDFLEKLSLEYNFTIYFSTHSLELIRGIRPDNIFYLQRHIDNSIEIIKPCYPAFATRSLYNEDYGYDVVILVEDKLAKMMVNKILREKRLLGNKRVLVLPAGGWQNVIRLAYDMINSKLLLNPTKILIMLDGDIQEEVPDFRKNHNLLHNEIKISYLPIPSLEKYLKNHLYDNVDHNLYRELGDYLFQRKSLNDIIKKYTNESEPLLDSDGKKLFGLLENELKVLKQDRDALINIVFNYLEQSEVESVNKISEFLENNI